MKNNDDSSKYAMGFIVAFAVVMATPAFAEKVMHTQTVEVTKNVPVTQTTTTTSNGPNGEVTTTRTTETTQPVTRTVTYNIAATDRSLMKKYLLDTYPAPAGGAVTKTTYVVGQPLPTGVTLLPLPASLQTQLTPVPDGYTYGMIDHDIVLLEADRDVADVISYYEVNK